MTTPSMELDGPEALVQRALAVIKADRLPYLATVEGHQPRLRPVAPLKTDGFTVYIANLRPYGKTSEIDSNPRVELCYLDHNDQVRITGTAEVVSDPVLKKTLWEGSAQLRRHLGESDSPEYILYRVVPSRVRFMKEWALTYREVPLNLLAKQPATP